MNYKTIITDQNLLEQIQYSDSSFPISFYEDYFDDFLNGEFNYHWHEEFEFGIVLKGEIEYWIHQKPTEQQYTILKEGDGIFVNSKVLHRAKQIKPGTILFNFVLPTNFFILLPLGSTYNRDILPIIQTSLSGLFLQSENHNDTELLNTLKEIYHLSKDSLGYELHCMELICRVWRQLLIRISQIKQFPLISKEERMQEQRVRLMLSYIHTHYGENITINSIAAAANIGRSECFRCFRAVLGKTPTEYLCKYRLSQATNLLINTNKKLYDICTSCGFNSLSYFGQLFKQQCGMSPGEYRVINKKNVKIKNKETLVYFEE